MRRARNVRRLVACLAGGAMVIGGVAAASQAVAANPAPAINTAPSYNGLALTPPMGFNDWAGFECNNQMNESLFTKTADAMVSLGLDKLGYQYVNIDDCWMQHDRDANGNLQ